MMRFTIETEQAEDARWIAEIPELPGVLAYGATRDEAIARAQALALRVIAERLEHDEGPAALLTVGNAPQAAALEGVRLGAFLAGFSQSTGSAVFRACGVQRVRCWR